FLLLPLFISLHVALAHHAMGRIVGNVTDQSGAASLSATVTLTNLGIRASHVTSTDHDGYYHVLLLPIGTYRTSLEHSGSGKPATIPGRQAPIVSRAAVATPWPFCWTAR